MNHLSDWRLFNVKNRLNAADFVKSNFYQLSQSMNVDCDLPVEEKERILIEYFTKYPDQIRTILIKSMGSDPKSVVPTVTNIGSQIKYL